MSFPNPLRTVDKINRSKTAAEWTAGNYQLAKGEVGYETDTGRKKIGVGSAWNDTDYALIGTGIDNIIALTQAAYDALTPDANTLYVITD
jgi:hypothetical protein